MDLYLTPWRKYVTFSGRATRSEYWIFTAVNFVITMILGFVSGMMTNPNTTDDLNPLFWVYMAFSLAALLPTIAVSIRRLHDTGRSGMWYLITFVPFIGGLVLLVFMIMPSQEGTNEYGPAGNENVAEVF